MVIIKFLTEGLEDIIVGKKIEENEVFVFLTYKNGKTLKLSKSIEGKTIEHYKETFMRNVGFVYFYEINEVFNIPEHEKISIRKNKHNKEEESNIQVKNGKSKSTNIEFNSDIEDDWFN